MDSLWEKDQALVQRLLRMSTGFRGCPQRYHWQQCSPAAVVGTDRFGYPLFVNANLRPAQLIGKRLDW